jgi:hypothetical protein
MRRHTRLCLLNSRAKLGSLRLLPIRKVKTVLIGTAFNNQHQVFQVVMDVLNGIQRDELETVFQEWFGRSEAWIWPDGDPVH